MDKIEMVRGIYEAYRNRDLEHINRVFDDEIEMRQTELLPWGGSYRGKEGVSAFFECLLGTISSVVEPGEAFESGDTVVQVGRSRGTVNATGRSFDVAEVHLWTFRDDKVVRFEGYIDTPAMLEVLSASPAGPTASVEG
jgi:ketosteroid isomerase-like protein